MQSECDDLKTAVIEGDLRKCEELMFEGIKPEWCDFDIVETAAAFGRVEILKSFYRFYPEIYLKRGIIPAVRNKKFKVAKLILQKDFFEEQEFYEIIEIAKENRDWRMVNLIEAAMKYGRRFERYYKDSLFEASVQNLDWEKVKKIIRTKSLTREDYSLALGVAVEHGEIDFVDWLLRDPRVNPKDGLQSAVYTNNPTILKMLLDDRRMPYPDDEYLILLDHTIKRVKDEEYFTEQEFDNIYKILELLERASRRRF